MLCNRIIIFFYTIFNFSSCNRIEFNNNKKKGKSHKPKLEFLKTQKFINLKQRCKKNKKIHQKIERERERDNLFMRENYVKNGRKDNKFIVKKCE